jgi:hypothetical protein
MIIKTLFSAALLACSAYLLVSGDSLMYTIGAIAFGGSFMLPWVFIE